MTVTELLIVAVAGLAAGGANALAGGGSLISFPALIAVGLPTLSANVTNTTALWPGYLGSVVGYRRELVGQRGRVIGMVGTALGGAAVGTVVLLAAPEAVFDVLVPALVLVSAGLLAFQPRISVAVAATRSPGEGGPGPGFHVALFAAAVYGAYFGGGVGVILLAILAIFLPEDLQRLNALKTVLSLVVNSAALVVFALFGPVEWIAVAVMAPASLVGGFYGARLARRLPPERLRLTVAGLGVAVAVWLAMRALG